MYLAGEIRRLLQNLSPATFSILSWVYSENKQRVPYKSECSKLIIVIFKWNIQKLDRKLENKNELRFD